jgi:hypothetical protein
MLPCSVYGEDALDEHRELPFASVTRLSTTIGLACRRGNPGPLGVQDRVRPVLGAALRDLQSRLPVDTDSRSAR